MTAVQDLVLELEKLGPRGAFGHALMACAEEFPALTVLSADLCGTTRVEQFRKAYPQRFVNAGIAEQNMVGCAVGLASCGKTVFCTTFAAFLSMRACEQIRTDVAYMNANVKIIGADAGVTIGTQGYTHYAIEDISIVRAMPNMTILSPCDGMQIAKAVRASAEMAGPVYMRLTGKPPLPAVYREEFQYQIGRAITLREGTDVTIIATGASVHHALSAADLLKERHGISVRVLDMHSIKPLDEKAVMRAARDTGLLVTVEEHNLLGGLGAAVCEVVAGLGGAPRVVRMGLQDKFEKIADYPYQLRRFGINTQGVATGILELLR